jgi:PncC family amidohydrolase
MSFFKLFHTTSPSPLAGLLAEGSARKRERGRVRGGGKDLAMELEKLIGDRLREKGWSLSIAESCTGGLICDRITDIPGSSDYFEGGMVTYSNESKAKYLGVPLDDIKKYGAVSPQVARRMAQGVQKAFNTTFGLSTTGVAGPTGGTKRSPVGRVFIGLASGRKVRVMKLDSKGNRREIKEKATEKALHFFYEMLVKKRGTKT